MKNTVKHPRNKETNPDGPKLANQAYEHTVLVLEE